jgi:hypothetical protein
MQTPSVDHDEMIFGLFLVAFGVVFVLTETTVNTEIMNL